MKNLTKTPQVINCVNLEQKSSVSDILPVTLDIVMDNGEKGVSTTYMNNQRQLLIIPSADSGGWNGLWNKLLHHADTAGHKRIFSWCKSFNYKMKNMPENENQLLQYVSTANSQNPVHIKYTSENIQYER